MLSIALSDMEPHIACPSPLVASHQKACVQVPSAVYNSGATEETTRQDIRVSRDTAFPQRTASGRSNSEIHPFAWRVRGNVNTDLQPSMSGFRVTCCFLSRGASC